MRSPTVPAADGTGPDLTLLGRGGMIGGMLADRPRAEFIGRERVLALLAFLATPIGVMALFLLMAHPFLPFVIVAALGASLLFARRLRSVGVGLLLGAAVWFGLLLWLSSHSSSID